MVKDTGNFGDGMHSSKVGIMDPAHGHFSDSRFSNMTKEAIEEYGKSILARQQKGKMTAEDIAAAKAVKEILGIYDYGNVDSLYKESKKDGDKKEGDKSAEGGKPSEAPPAAPAAGSEELPPELDPSAAPEKEPSLTQAKPEEKKESAPAPTPAAPADQGQALTTMMIDGQKVAVP